jgi:hypothetical protein
VKLPFTFSSDGERYVREYIAREPPLGMEASLNASPRMTVRDKDGRLTQRFEGEHYFFGFSPPSKHTDHIHFDLFGRRVAIHSKTVEVLRGKQFTVVQSEKIDGVDYTRDILVARSTDETTKET